MATIIGWIVGLFICGGLGGLLGIQFSTEKGGYVGMLVGAFLFAAFAIWLNGPYGKSRSR
jgi:hypothetical protein